jgi:hypothetical protein
MGSVWTFLRKPSNRQVLSFTGYAQGQGLFSGGYGSRMGCQVDNPDMRKTPHTGWIKHEYSLTTAISRAGALRLREPDPFVRGDAVGRPAGA